MSKKTTNTQELCDYCCKRDVCRHYPTYPRLPIKICRHYKRGKTTTPPKEKNTPQKNGEV